MTDAALRRLLMGITAGLLCAIVVYAYVHDPAVPGGQFPEGWWGWYDQGKTLASTQAFLHGDLRTASHWYPLGYSLLAVPFAAFTHDHAFLPVNLLCLVGTYVAALALARRLGLGIIVASCGIALGLVGDEILLRNWAIPWNTAPAAALTWTLLACCTAQIQGRSRGWAIGLCAAGIAACRPTDALVAIPCLLATAWACRAQPGRWATLARLAGGIAAVAVPYGLLYLAIYGPAPSPYMIESRVTGFTAADAAWRAYVILVDPVEWFADGEGLIRRCPWILPGLAGLPIALARPAARPLAVTLLAHLALYIAYVDLLPTGLWRYLNVHYFAWALPGYALLGLVLLRDLLLRAGGWRWAAASLVGVLLLSAVRLHPVLARPEQAAKMVELAGPTPPFLETYFSQAIAMDGAGPLANITAVRLIPFAGGTRVIGLRRRIEGTLQWPAGPPLGIPPAAAQTRYAIAFGIGWPRWLHTARVQRVLPP